MLLRLAVQASPARDHTRLVNPVVRRATSFRQFECRDVRVVGNIRVFSQLQNCDVVGKSEVAVVYPIRMLQSWEGISIKKSGFQWFQRFKQFVAYDRDVDNAVRFRLTFDFSLSIVSSERNKVVFAVEELSLSFRCSFLELFKTYGPKFSAQWAAVKTVLAPTKIAPQTKLGWASPRSKYPATKHTSEFVKRCFYLRLSSPCQPYLPGGRASSPPTILVSGEIGDDVT